MADSGGEPSVVYGIKELLAEIRDSVHRLDGKLDTKADKATVDGLSTRVSDLESWRTSRSGAESQKARDSDYRRWLLPLMVSVILSAPAWLQSLGIT